VALLAASNVVHADISFSNVLIGGSLSGGSSFTTSAHDIDFIFTQALVGDPVDPLRSGNITISYIAESTAGLVQDSLTLSVLGALSGSGTIELSEMVEDLNNPGTILSTHNATLTQNSQLPHTAVLNFSTPSTRIQVTKQLELTAVVTPADDFAQVSLIEQTLHEVPEPATVAFLALGLFAFMRRRR
jgi:hypothetical protein